MLLVVQVVEETGETPGRFILAEPPGIRPHDRLHRQHMLEEVRVFRVLGQDRPGLISGHSGTTQFHDHYTLVYLITDIDDYNKNRYSNYTMPRNLVNARHKSIGTLRYTAITCANLMAKYPAGPVRQSSNTQTSRIGGPHGHHPGPIV